MTLAIRSRRTATSHPTSLKALAHGTGTKFVPAPAFNAPPTVLQRVDSTLSGQQQPGQLRHPERLTSRDGSVARPSSPSSYWSTALS